MTPAPYTEDTRSYFGQHVRGLRLTLWLPDLRGYILPSFPLRAEKGGL